MKDSSFQFRSPAAAMLPRSTGIAPLALSIAGILGLLVSGAAFAAGTAGADAEAPTPAAADADRAESAEHKEDDAVRLGAVVVTANKRLENVQDVAASITVLEGAQLESMHATELSDFANYVPGFQLSSDGSPGQARVSMRGIAPLSAGAVIGTYIDDAPVGSNGIYQQQVLFTMDLLPYDIDHVEILRGPQGTLYGAGSMGGLIKYVMKAPDLHETELRAGAGVSSVSHGGTGHDARIGVNLPLAADRLGLRLSYGRNKIPGYIDNPLDGRKDINDGLQTSARVALLWEGDDTRLQLSAMRQTIDTDNDARISLRTDALRPIGGDLENKVWIDQRFKKDIDHVALSFDWNLGWADFTSASAWSKLDTLKRSDTTVSYGNFADLALGLPDPGSSNFDQFLHLKQFTQEFRLTSPGNQALEWMLGAFYSHERARNRQYIGLHQLDGSPMDPPYDEMFGTLADLFLPSLYIERALFANGAYHFTDRFKFGLGARWASNRQKFTQDAVAGILLPLEVEHGASRENVFTWNVSPQFQLTEDAMVYAKVATGYQPGGPNVAFPGMPTKVDSARLTSYEAGLKGLFADRRAQLDLALFRINWKDIQVPTVHEGKSGMVNGGRARTNGVELATLFTPSASVQFGFNAAWTDAKLSEDYETIYVPSPPYLVEITGGLSGDRLPYVPKYSASAFGDYFFALGSWEGNVGGGLRYTAARVSGTRSQQLITDGATPPTVLDAELTYPNRLPAYHALDLHAGISNEHWSIRAYVKNATDKRAYSSIANQTNEVTGERVGRIATPIRPRTFGLQVDYRF